MKRHMGYTYTEVDISVSLFPLPLRRGVILGQSLCLCFTNLVCKMWELIKSSVVFRVVLRAPDCFFLKFPKALYVLEKTSDSSSLKWMDTHLQGLLFFPSRILCDCKQYPVNIHHRQWLYTVSRPHDILQLGQPYAVFIKNLESFLSWGLFVHYPPDIVLEWIKSL